MECSVDVFVGNSTIIDPEICINQKHKQTFKIPTNICNWNSFVDQLWVDGNSAHEAADILQQRGILQQWGANMDLLMSDVLDHYRTFHMLEKTLHTPLKLTAAGEWTFQMEADTQQLLIEKYIFIYTIFLFFISHLQFIHSHILSPDIMNWMMLL